MIPLLALALLVGVTDTKPSAYPATAVLDAFKGICGNPASIDAVRGAARSNGWDEFTPAPTSNLGKLLVTGKSMVPQVVPNGMKIDLSEFITFRKHVAGLDIEASVDTAKTASAGKKISVTGCQVYDFSAPEMLDDNALTSWAGRAPDKRVDYAGQLTAWSWDSAPTVTDAKFSVAFAPKTSPLANPARLMVLGLVFKAEHISVTQ